MECIVTMVTTNLAVSNNDELGLTSVFLVCSATAELRENIRGGDLCVLWRFGNLLLLGPVYHVTDCVDVGM